MKEIFILWAVLVLVGCNTPSRDFRGVEATRITVGKSTFDVRINGRRAEAIRLNPEYAPRLESVAARAFAAIEKVSGCEVRRMGGDQALIHATLKCKGDPDTLPPLPHSIRYDCDIEDVYTNGGLGIEVTEMVCNPVGF